MSSPKGAKGRRKGSKKEYDRLQVVSKVDNGKDKGSSVLDVGVIGLERVVLDIYQRLYA